MKRALIGFLMKAYRRSPLHPGMGPQLAKLMAVVIRQRRSEPFLHEVDGVTFEVDLGEVIDASLYYSDTFEEKAEAVITDMLRPGMVAIDVGANFGYHTFRMSKGVDPGGQVLAIEPTTWAHDKLMRNAGLNAMTNISYAKVGLSDTDVGDTEIAFTSSYRLDGESRSTVETVRLITLDTLLDELGLTRVDFIKLDVDGFEGKVLHGSVRTLETHQPALFFEISPSAMELYGDNAYELISWLQDLGYQFEDEDRHHITDLDAYLRGISDGTSVNLLAVPVAAGSFVNVSRAAGSRANARKMDPDAEQRTDSEA